MPVVKTHYIQPRKNVDQRWKELDSPHKGIMVFDQSKTAITYARFCVDEDPVYEDKMLPMYTYPNNTEHDLDLIVDQVMYLADRYRDTDLIYYNRHRLFIEDTKYLVGFYREDLNNKEEK